MDDPVIEHTEFEGCFMNDRDTELGEVLGVEKNQYSNRCTICRLTNLERLICKECSAAVWSSRAKKMTSFSYQEQSHHTLEAGWHLQAIFLVREHSVWWYSNGIFDFEVSTSVNNSSITCKAICSAGEASNQIRCTCHSCEQPITSLTSLVIRYSDMGQGRLFPVTQCCGISWAVRKTRIRRGACSCTRSYIQQVLAAKFGAWHAWPLGVKTVDVNWGCFPSRYRIHDFSDPDADKKLAPLEFFSL